MKGINFLICVSVTLLCLLLQGCMSCEYIDQNEIGFKYNVNSGKGVSTENNPQLPFGWAANFGWNAEIFVINSEVNSYSFTADIHDPKSPWDESLTWDSIEGVTMQVDYTILGRVTDPWKFYANYGRAQRSFSGIEGIQDARIYEAIREAGEFVGVHMNELASGEAADLIRKSPARYTQQLTKDTAEYAEHFGFTIMDIIFPDRMVFPSDNEGVSTITRSRALLESVNSDLEKKKKEVATIEGEKQQKIANANIEARKVLGEANRRAGSLKIEAEALANQMKVSIDQIGVDGAMQLKMAELQNELLDKGVIRQVYLTGDSLFGAPFYGVTKHSLTGK
ncbi:MAG: hypothetical protein A3F54_03660 [Candidatus Kerfeldbacteria bacterium RIFCSPHIGHO2_12_FULL_48_17]|uniref:Band 7 domain-containing protein n=1 Tax=Candidatus Kerfeldbacteria bacterium RIFCSPHIGHO2_12_FULL_48_17 TaxID=1798542 RepID=A0A1G2AYK5_9BACT|nr:MAG: hypothetical protein A3F54_03660 [Candidatus Kerfeldbacteria bacterium RIFCSPHIGHO2_12_FULL_48_17]